MPVTDIECPNCDIPIHSDGFFSGTHDMGCGEEIPDEVMDKYWDLEE
ncbi:MAG: hypothetical protein J07AB43_01710 [Candidatus Nanosalina sp. J07AB43]|jgi:hypothetical protein|nr:MAG: hypothetical protein J07AB43_01710 [Candidatus Nanosalina sp. J07AB43]